MEGSHKSGRYSRLRLHLRNLSRRSSAKADLPLRSLANGANGMSDMAGKAARVRGRAQRELPRYKAGSRERESDRHSLTACPTQPVPTIFRPTNFPKAKTARLDRPPGREFSHLRGVYVQKQKLM